MDALDRATVLLYRSGLGVAAAGLLLAAAGLIFRPTVVGWAWAAVAAGVGLSVVNMHLYAKLIRWVIGAAAWSGVVLMYASPLGRPIAAHWVGFAGLGLLFVALSAFALKEQFCFKVPLLRAVPLFLAASLIPLVGGAPYVASPLLAVAGAVLVTLVYQKSRMPLHFDVGDKSAYQI